jgi:lycopene beta-cyclase
MTHALLGPVFTAWVFVMIAVPLLAGYGNRHPGRESFYRGLAISSGVVAQVILVVVTLAVQWTLAPVIRAVILVPLLGWLAEFIGSRTGIPFGKYHYTDILQPQIHRVPLVIPMAWLMMLPPSWAAARFLAPGAPPVVHAALSGFAFTAWDLYLDPHLVKWQFWTWREAGSYQGIPLKNFFGWFLWATLITYLVAPAELDFFPLVVVYTLTWLFQFGGHMVFWRWPVSGIVGFVAMGSVAVPAILRFLMGR